MKIAVVGKGGSGKSAVTWLLANVAAANGKDVYVIDADHNMDTAATFGITVSDTTDTFHRHHTLIRSILKLDDSVPWGSLLNNTSYPTTIPLTDNQLDTFWHKTPLNIKVGVVGLGSTDILGSGRCAHGHSAGLKWLLPCLSPTNNQMIIIDGVAGVDMMNYGLYVGVDALIVLAEHHQNSERVATQIMTLATKTSIPAHIVGNRSTPTTHETIIATIPADSGIKTFNQSTLTPDSLTAAHTILATCKKRTKTALKASLQALHQ